MTSFILVQATLTELFPSWKGVKKYREVIIFTVGLVKDPRPLVDYIYEMLIEDYLDDLRKAGDGSKVLEDLFRTLYAESSVPLPDYPLQNRHLNSFNHFYRPNSETTVINTPSKLYEFKGLKKQIVCEIEHMEHKIEIPDCAIVIHSPMPVVTNNVLSNSRNISKHYPLTHLFMYGVVCDHFAEPDVFNLSENAQSIRLWKCKLPCKVLSHLLQQMPHCKQLRTLYLEEITLDKAGLHQIHYRCLVQAIRSWGDNPPLQILNLESCALSGNVCAELLQSLSTCKHLNRLNVSHNTLTGCLSSFVPDPHPGLPQLEFIGLVDTALNKDDLQHLLSIANKLPKLEALNLSHYKLKGCLSSFLPDPHPGLLNLSRLNLTGASFTKEDLHHLLLITHKLPKLSTLDFSYSILTGCLSSFLPDPHAGLPELWSLDLRGTGLNKKDLQHLFSIIQRDKLPKLKQMYLSDNKLKACLSSFLTDPHPGLPQLQTLFLTNAALNKKDLQHLTHLIQNKKLPCLNDLRVEHNRLCKKEKELGELIETSVANHHMILALDLRYNNLSKKFKKEWEGRCEGTNTVLFM